MKFKTLLTLAALGVVGNALGQVPSTTPSIRGSGQPSVVAGPVVRDHRLRYNQVQQLSSHNSYDDNGPKDNIETQLARGIRSFELDLHNDAAAGNWSVYHVTHVFSGGNYIDNLKGGLAKFRKYHNEHPNHDVITIWFELKDDWKGDGHNPADLDATIDASMGGLIYRPAMLKQGAPGASNLRDAIRRVGWPELDSLGGKFIFVMMGNDKANERYLYDVLGYDGGFRDGHQGYVGNRNIFAAPEDNVLAKLNLKPGDNWLNAVFFNCHNNDGLNIPAAVYRAGFVSRVWRIDSQAEYNVALASKAQHIATDHVTRNLFLPHLVDGSGRPFRPIGP